MSQNDDADAAVSRRGFLQAAGFALAAVASGCTRGTEQFVPSAADANAPLRGRARLEYATACGGCSAGCGVLAQVRAGRPIKLEGMPDHPISRGGLCAVGQASILGAFDQLRLAAPRIRSEAVSWSHFDDAVRHSIESANRAGRSVRVLLGPQEASSPTTVASVHRLLEECTDGAYCVYDPLEASALGEAHADLLGGGLVPRFRFDGADIVVGMEADFLGTWLSPVEHAAAYAAHRPRLHVQVESRLSLTGSKADRRIVLHPWRLSATLRFLLERLQHLTGNMTSLSAGQDGPASLELSGLARRLWANRGRALVVCGSQETTDQLLCRQINEALDAYGSTIDIDRASRQRLGDRAGPQELLDELQNGTVDVLIVAGANPVHDAHDGELWEESLHRVPTVIGVAERVDETVRAATMQCPVPNALASWGDVEPVEGLYCLRQPVMSPGFAHRSLAALLTAWHGASQSDYELVREYWRAAVYREQHDGLFEAFWDRTVQVGWVQRELPVRTWIPAPGRAADVDASDAGLVLVPYVPVATLDGRQGYNPWLLELPDPMTKVTWGNPAAISPARARRLGISEGDVVRISLADDPRRAIELPVVIQPGQHDDVIAVAIGFGQEISRRFAAVSRRSAQGPHATAAQVGVNVAPLTRQRFPRIELGNAGRKSTLARTQINLVEQHPHEGHGGVAVKDLVRRTPAADRVPAPSAASPTGWRGMWGATARATDVRWGMSIDLDACTGCSACVVACQIENNVPVVGAEEVRRNREMHWLRIDRYYREVDGGLDVAHQPMTCHHCGHAPCESVCPVLATTHSQDGLNQQVYSRCVGTRYCMNNCPFKVRRFNWFENRPDETFDASHLNPEVTLRSRGVVEKCSLCAHRIQDARLAARQEGRDLRDGEGSPACVQSCPSRAIVFGNLADPTSAVSRAARSGRAYTLFEDLNLAPAVTYQAIRTRDVAWDDEANS